MALTFSDTFNNPPFTLIALLFFGAMSVLIVRALSLGPTTNAKETPNFEANHFKVNGGLPQIDGPKPLDEGKEHEMAARQLKETVRVFQTNCLSVIAILGRLKAVMNLQGVILEDVVGVVSHPTELDGATTNPDADARGTAGKTAASDSARKIGPESHKKSKKETDARKNKKKARRAAKRAGQTTEPLPQEESRSEISQDDVGDSGIYVG